MKLLLISWLITLAIAADYYEILGIDKSASERDIKKAYRQLSRQYHPDKNSGSEEAAQKFVEIGHAYEVLSDADQRAKYDRFGEAGLGNQPQQDPFDIFSHLFGGNFHRNQGRPRGPDARGAIQVTLQDNFKGSTIEFTAEMQGICDECDGTGSADGKTHTCDQCRGSGQIIRSQQLAFGMVQRIQSTCDKCGGRGQQIVNKCPVCQGQRVIREVRKYNIFLPEGAQREWDYVLEGEGEQSPDYDPGNLIIRLTEGPEGNFGYRRRGSDLFRSEVLSEAQAKNGGWKREVLRLDGVSTLKLGRASGESIINGQIDKISGEGMPKSEDEAGDLYITYVVIPNGSSRGEVRDEL